MSYCICSPGGSCRQCKPDEWFKIETRTSVVWQKKSEMIKERKIKMKFKKASPYDIRIKHTANGGMIVKVGCCELSFSGYKMMLEAMEEYYDNPETIEKLYNESMQNEGPQAVADCGVGDECCESRPEGVSPNMGAARNTLRTNPLVTGSGPDRRR